MKLSIRLNAVKDTVKKCKTVCDIGCDHGYVSIALAKEGVAEYVIACDVNKGPLEAARENISRENLSEKIDTRLGDGLHKITVDDNPDAIVIAGMGGRLMARILEEGKEIVNGASQLILQPQSELFLVRKWLRDNGFLIEKEQALTDMGKYYFIISAIKGCEPVADNDYMQVLFDTYSRFLIENKDSVLKEYLMRLHVGNEQNLAKISDERSGELKAANKLIEEALKLMDSF